METPDRWCSWVGLGMDYTTLSLAAITTELEDIARDAQATFGGLDALQLNWRPEPAKWSVAQCLEHLVISNQWMFRAAGDALGDARPRTVWQRLPVLPGVVGRMLIRSQSPAATRQFTTSSKAAPATSDIGADIVRRFVEQHRDALTRVRALDERAAAGAIMTSPFLRVIAYSVLDGWRLLVAHDRRHLAQARRVMLLPEFPGR